jgi:hypothetical protein
LASPLTVSTVFQIFIDWSDLTQFIPVRSAENPTHSNVASLSSLLYIEPDDCGSSAGLDDSAVLSRMSSSISEVAVLT